MYGTTSNASGGSSVSGTSESGKYVIYRVNMKPSNTAKPGTIAVKAPLDITGFRLMFSKNYYNSLYSNLKMGALIYMISETTSYDATYLKTSENPMFAFAFSSGQMYQKTSSSGNGLTAVDAWMYAASTYYYGNYGWKSINH